jgi:mycothiol synthase
MTAGFARLAGRGIRSAALYVDSDNEPAVALYRSLGFRTHSVDIQYRLSR